jgi:ABC-2 type transport system permease protein
MKSALKAEFRKLFTVRSTYIILGLTLALVIFYGFYIAGWRIDKADLMNPTTMANNITGAISTVSIFSALVAVLLFAHEYRYNTILYTLTAANSRSKVLLAKILTISVFALVFTTLAGVIAPLMVLWGIHAHGLHLVAQTLHYHTLVWKCLFYGWGYSMAGLVITALIRNQIGSIVTLFIVPGTVEALLGLLLKKNVVYLPFSALNTVIGNRLPDITPVHAAMVFGGYLVVGWIVAWILFLRRDATT